MAKKEKETFGENNFHNLCGLFYVVPNFLYTTTETMREYDF